MHHTRSYLFVRLGLAVAQVGLLVLGTFQQASAAGVIYVRAGAAGANNGSSWSNAYRNLQTALSVAVSGQQIWVAKGTYFPTSGTDRTRSFILRNGVAIYGGFAGNETLLSQRRIPLNETILSGNIGDVDANVDNSLHVVRGGGTNSTAILDGFTIRDGYSYGTSAPSYGAGVYNSDSSPTLRNLLIIANTAESGCGGGMYNKNSNPSLTNVTFTDFAPTGSGGGMCNESSSPTLSHVTFDNNYAYIRGGGMSNDGNSSPVLTNVVFSNNTVTGGGGGMYNEGNPTLTNVSFIKNTSEQVAGGFDNEGVPAGTLGKPTLRNVTFTGNSAAQCGGMENSYYGNPTLSNVTFKANVAIGETGDGGQGGGLCNDSALGITLTAVTFSGNHAFMGGGMENGQLATARLTDVTFSGNSASSKLSGGYGGAMANSFASPMLNNVTFTGNTASTGGGAIYNSNKSNPLIKNSILWGDAPDEIYNDPASNTAPSTATVTDGVLAGTCPTGVTCTNAINADPMLGPLASNGGFTQTMALGAGSAAIDAGGAHTPCSGIDQRGVKRPQGAACDIGAYEVKVMTLQSQPAYDGWMLESGQGTNVGGTSASSGPSLMAGDQSENLRYRSVVSFDTSALPDAGSVVRATLKVQQASAAANPFSTQGRLLADLANPYFGAGPGLAAADWQAPAKVNAAGFLGSSLLANGSWYSAELTSMARAQINKTGTTQFRLRFGLDTYDGLAQYIMLYSGENPTAAARPTLVLYYNP